MAESLELKIPDIGDADSIELVQWNIEPGQAFSAGDELCELVTDKAAFSLEAEAPGVLHEIKIPAKSQVKPGMVAAIATSS